MKIARNRGMLRGFRESIPFRKKCYNLGIIGSRDTFIVVGYVLPISWKPDPLNLTIVYMSGGIRSELISELMNRAGSYVSGGDLSKQLDVSRVSIKNHMDQLVDLGFQIEAVRNRGYRLLDTPKEFESATFRHFIQGILPEEQIYTFENIDSTNLELDRQLNAGSQAPMVAIAREQSSGKGRRGNRWESQLGSNLYISLGFRPNLPISRIGQYTLWLGIKLAEYLREEIGVEVMVKWPNDLYLNGQKLAGILSEAKIDTDHVQHLIVGLGLNINSTKDRFPAELRSKATSIYIATGEIQRFNKLAAGIARTMLHCSDLYFEKNRNQEIQDYWKHYDFLAGKRVQAKRTRNTIEGVAEGIDDQGELRIRLNDGSIHQVNSGEVTMAFEK